MIKLKIAGKPQQKNRPRFTKGGIAYKLPAEREAEQDFKLQAAMQMKRDGLAPYPKDTPLKVVIFAAYKRPKGIAHDKLLKTSRPDIDNVVKFVLDGLNGIAYYDDAQVFEVHAGKYYDDIAPFTAIEITAAGKAPEGHRKTAPENQG